MINVMAILRQTLHMLALTGILLLLIATFIGSCGWQSYFADQCSQLRLAYVFSLVILVGPLLWLRSRPGLVLAAAVLFLNFAQILPFYFSAEARGQRSPIVSSDGRNIALITVNLYGAHNQQYQKVVDFVQQKHPDILCLNEVTPGWLQQMNKSLPEYKYHFDEGISGGAAIYSRIPIEKTCPLKKKGQRRYGVRGTIKVGGQQVLLVAAHPPAPIGKNRWKLRNQELECLSAEFVNREDPYILIGDLNSTPWSPYFQQLVRRGKLTDSELGRGIQPSWHALLMVPPMVPIDHCLTSNQFVTLQRLLGPNLGSDHLPVCVTLRFEPAKEPHAHRLLRSTLKGRVCCPTS